MHTHPFTPQTDTSPTPRPRCRGPAARPPLRQLAPGLRTGLESWASCWRRRVSPCCPAGASPRAPGPASLGCSSGSGQSPWGLGACAGSSPSRCGSCAPGLACSGRPSAPVPSEGRWVGGAGRFALRRAARLRGGRCPRPRSAPVAPRRAQSNDCPRPRLPRLGRARPPGPGATHLPSSARPSAPGLPPAGDAGPGMEAFVFISDWGGRAAAHGPARERGAGCRRAEERGRVWRARGKDGPGSAPEAGWMLQDSTDPFLFFFEWFFFFEKKIFF